MSEFSYVCIVEQVLLGFPCGVRIWS